MSIWKHSFSGHPFNNAPHVDIVKLLLENGIHINPVVPLNSCSPLDHALWYGCKETAKILLENGANINPCTLYHAAGLDAELVEMIIKKDNVIKYTFVKWQLHPLYY